MTGARKLAVLLGLLVPRPQGFSNAKQASRHHRVESEAIGTMWAGANDKNAREPRNHGSMVSKAIQAEVRSHMWWDVVILTQESHATRYSEQW
jgi:hypothetical protein